MISAPLNISGGKVHAMTINIFEQLISYNIIDKSVRLLAFLTWSTLHDIRQLAITPYFTNKQIIKKYYLSFYYLDAYLMLKKLSARSYVEPPPGMWRLLEMRVWPNL